MLICENHVLKMVSEKHVSIQHFALTSCVLSWDDLLVHDLAVLEPYCHHPVMCLGSSLGKVSTTLLDCDDGRRGRAVGCNGFTSGC